MRFICIVASAHAVKMATANTLGVRLCVCAMTHQFVRLVRFEISIFVGLFFAFHPRKLMHENSAKVCQRYKCNFTRIMIHFLPKCKFKLEYRCVHLDETVPAIRLVNAPHSDRPNDAGSWKCHETIQFFFLFRFLLMWWSFVKNCWPVVVQ